MMQNLSFGLKKTSVKVCFFSGVSKIIAVGISSYDAFSWMKHNQLRLFFLFYDIFFNPL